MKQKHDQHQTRRKEPVREQTAELDRRNAEIVRGYSRDELTGAAISKFLGDPAHEGLPQPAFAGPEPGDHDTFIHDRHNAAIPVNITISLISERASSYTKIS